MSFWVHRYGVSTRTRSYRWSIVTSANPPKRESYVHNGGGESLLWNTGAQVEAPAPANTLAEVLPSKEDSKPFVAMRYWHPMADDSVQAAAK